MASVWLDGTVYRLLEVVVLITHPEQLDVVSLSELSVLKLVLTNTRYIVAPETDDQSSVGRVETFVAPFEGLSKAGVESCARPTPGSSVQMNMLQATATLDRLGHFKQRPDLESAIAVCLLFRILVSVVLLCMI